MAEIILDQVISPAITSYVGASEWDIEAGGGLRIRSKDDAATPIYNVLESQVPAGKLWRVSVSVRVEESDI